MAYDLDASFPFVGVGDGIVTLEQMQEIEPYWGKTYGVGAYGDHVGNGFEVFADSTGAQVKVRSGECWIRAVYGYHEDQETVTISGSAPSGGQARIARVVLRVVFASKKIEVDVLPGTNAATADVVAPALTQNATMWEISLAQVLITNVTAASIPAGAVTDERPFCRSRSGRQPGEIFWWPTAHNIPGGCVYAQGQAASRITYAEAAAVWDPGGTGVLIVPDMRGVVAVGMDDGASRFTISGAGTPGAIVGSSSPPISVTTDAVFEAGSNRIGVVAVGPNQSVVQPSRMGYWLAALRPI